MRGHPCAPRLFSTVTTVAQSASHRACDVDRLLLISSSPQPCGGRILVRVVARSLQFWYCTGTTQASTTCLPEATADSLYKKRGVYDCTERHSCLLFFSDTKRAGRGVGSRGVCAAVSKGTRRGRSRACCASPCDRVDIIERRGGSDHAGVPALLPPSPPPTCSSLPPLQLS